MPSKERPSLEYRDYAIKYDPPPIPDRSHDWNYAHKEYDGAPDSGDHRSGTAPTYDDARAAIDEQLAEQFPPL